MQLGGYYKITEFNSYLSAYFIINFMLKTAIAVIGTVSAVHIASMSSSAYDGNPGQPREALAQVVEAEDPCHKFLDEHDFSYQQKCCKQFANRDRKKMG